MVAAARPQSPEPTHFALYVRPAGPACLTEQDSCIAPNFLLSWHARQALPLLAVFLSLPLVSLLLHSASIFGDAHGTC
jgi:hypothetical protein